MLIKTVKVDESLYVLCIFKLSEQFREILVILHFWAEANMQIKFVLYILRMMKLDTVAISEAEVCIREETKYSDTHASSFLLKFFMHNLLLYSRYATLQRIPFNLPFPHFSKQAYLQLIKYLNDLIVICSCIFRRLNERTYFQN